jgi:glyoxylase-like metal-dependent hydrolase (beta-lactamase superfamily II)
MASLDKLRGRAETIYWPGHGGPVVEPQRYVRALLHHRRQREASILNALADGPQTIPALVAKVYVGLNPSLTHAAGLSTLAHLEDLSERGVVVGEAGDSGEQRFRLA